MVFMHINMQDGDHINDNFHKTMRQRGGKQEDIIQRANAKCCVATITVKIVGH